MKEFKTLGYDWECGHEDLIIRVYYPMLTENGFILDYTKKKTENGRTLVI